MKGDKTFTGPDKWLLYWNIVALSSLVIMVCWWFSVETGEQQYRQMIRISVRVALPIFLTAFAASSIHLLWPGTFSYWLMQNRKYIGLAFSSVMIWQIVFILLLYSTGVEVFSPGIGTIFLTSDLLGYTLLLLMSITSFNNVRRYIKPSLWKILHKSGMYYLWFIFFYSFALGTFYYDDPLTRLGYALLFLMTAGAGVLRFCAFKARMKNSAVGITRI